MASDLQFVFDGGRAQEVESLFDLVVDGVEAVLPVLDAVGGLRVGRPPTLVLGRRQIFGAQHQRAQAVAREALGGKTKLQLMMIR